MPGAYRRVWPTSRSRRPAAASSGPRSAATLCSASTEPSNGAASSPSTSSSRTCSTASANASSSAIQPSLRCSSRRSSSTERPGPAISSSLDRTQRVGVSLPRHQLRRDRALLEHADPVEVLDVVDRVRDVVGGVHHRRLDGLLPVGDAPRERRPGLPQVRQLGHVGAELGRPAERIVRRRAGSARRRLHVCVRRSRRVHGYFSIAARTAAVRSSPIVVAPDLGTGDDPVRLRVALEAVGQAEPLPGQPIEDALAEVAERRVARGRGRGRPPRPRPGRSRRAGRAARRSAPVSRSAIARATCATLRLCVSRLCTSSPEPPGLITWVTPPSRAKNGELTIRSRSTRNGLLARSPAVPPKSRSARLSIRSV